MRNPFRYFNSSPEVIRLAVMMYVRYPLSLRQVEDLLFERGIDVCHETVRYWWNRFGPLFAGEIRRRRVGRRNWSNWRWPRRRTAAQRRGAMLPALLRRVTVSGDTIRIELSNRALLDGTTGPGMIDTIEPGEPATIEVPFQLRRRGVEIRLVLRAEGAEAPDDKLVALVARSHRWLDQLTSGAIASIREIAQAEGIDGGDVSRFLPLAFLAPEIVEALMNGRQGVELTAEKMRQILPIPCSWREQRHQLNL